MHILGLCNGSPDGNSEILLKAALTAATESNSKITTSWVHIPSVSIPLNPKPLQGSLNIASGGVSPSPMTLGRDEDSAVHDDRAMILNAILDADALIFSTPVYTRQPPAFLKAITDRIMGPFTDASLALRIHEGKKAGAPEYKDVQLDERLLKTRAVGFMCVAGSTTPENVTMALPTLHQLVYPLHAKVIDQVVFMGYVTHGSVICQDGGSAVRRAQKLGRNVASQMDKHFDSAQYLGPEPVGACPYCHLTKIDLFCTSGNEIGCLVCGAQGKLAVGKDGTIKPEWEQDSEISSITMKGKWNHVDYIQNRVKDNMSSAEKDPEYNKKRNEWRNVNIHKL